MTITAGILSVAADTNLGTAPGVATAGQLVFNGGTLLVTTSFTLATNRGIALTGAGTLSINAGLTLAYGGIIAGTGALTKAGTGSLTLSGTNTYSGTTTISAGDVRVQSSAALGTTAGGTSIASGTAIEIDGSALSIAEPVTSIIGTGIGNTGAIRNLANNNTWSGPWCSAPAERRIQSDAGTLFLGAFSGATRPLTVQGSGNVEIDGAIATTTGTLTKAGSRHAHPVGRLELHRRHAPSAWARWPWASPTPSARAR